MRFSRSASPDLHFSLGDVIAVGGRVATRWNARGTHVGDLPGLPATGKLLTFSSQTIYEIENGRDWQIVDRLGFVREAKATPPVERVSTRRTRHPQ